MTNQDILLMVSLAANALTLVYMAITWFRSNQELREWATNRSQDTGNNVDDEPNN